MFTPMNVRPNGGEQTDRARPFRHLATERWQLYRSFLFPVSQRSIQSSVKLLHDHLRQENGRIMPAVSAVYLEVVQAELEQLAAVGTHPVLLFHEANASARVSRPDRSSVLLA